MHIQLVHILILLSLSQGFIFGFVLLFSKVFKGGSNKYLAYSILMISMMGMNEVLATWGLDDQYYFIDVVGDDIPWVLLFYVPLLFFFLDVLKHPWAHHPQRWLLSIPFWIFFAMNLVIDLDLDFDLYELPQVEVWRRPAYAVEYYLGLAYSLILHAVSYRIIQTSAAKGTPHTWVWRIWIFVTGLLTAWMCISVWPLDYLFGENFWTQCLWMGIAGFIFWLSYKGLYQFRLAQDRAALVAFMPQRIPLDTKTFPQKESSQVFSKDPSYMEALEQLLSKSHVYRNPDLSRDQVAGQLGLSPGYLSQIINRATGNNFSHFINTYRVEEVKRMIQDPAFDRYSLLAIGMEAGFKSKSAFYQVFKKEVGKTPSQYKKQRD